MISNPLFHQGFCSTGPHAACVDTLIEVSHKQDKPTSKSTPSRSSQPKKNRSTTFKVHRIVISRHSDYFMRILQEKESQSTQILEANETSGPPVPWTIHIEFDEKQKKLYDLFPQFIDYLYGKPIASQEALGFEFLELANMFEAPSLKELASESLASAINKDTAFNLLIQSIKYDAISVQEKCLDVVAKNFQTLYSNPAVKSSINKLPIHLFTALLNHHHLSVSSEYRVYKISRSYYNHNVDENGYSTLTKTERKQLFSAVRIPFLKFSELEKVVKDRIIPKSLLSEALNYRLSFYEKPNTTEPDSLPLRLRRRTVGPVFEHSFDMDTNGVLYYLATNGGKSEWKNPSLTGCIKVSVSSVEKGKPHNLVDREASDFWSKDIPASWISVDLRQGKLIPSHYTLRHGGNSKMDTLRNWVLQACDDGDKWQEISRHTNDASLQGAYGTHTWKINADNTKAFRQFRILQTGHNSGNTNFLALSGIEFYGTFFPKQPV